MCYNAQSSILSYLLGISGSIGLYNIKLVPESLFFGWISQLQLVDYILWKNQPCNITESKKICKLEEIKSCNKINKQTTTTGMILNNLEPVILFMSIIIFSKKKLPIWVICLVFLFMIVMMVYTIDTIKKKDTVEKECTYVTEQSYPHLFWQWNYNEPYNGFIYTFFVILFVILAYYGFSNTYFSSIMILLSYIVSFIIYKDKKSIGTMWCYISAFFPWVLYGYNTQLISKIF
jgi:hypothetical protein